MSEMRVEIVRVELELECLSSLFVYNEKNEVIFTCKGLEPPNKGNQRNISCIPYGTYWVIKEGPTQKHPYVHFRVKNVPGRQNILWHKGNLYSHTLGCYLVGESFGDRNGDGVLDVLSSGVVLPKLVALLPDRFLCEYKKKAA